MGLDAYLMVRKYVSNRQEGTKRKVSVILDTLGLAHLPKVPFLYCEIAIAYWRKANQIHAYFESLAGCQIPPNGSVELSSENLEDLLDKCEQALETRASGDAVDAEYILPTTPGFFFGSTDYDDDYYETLEYTIDVLRDILSNEDLLDEDFVYQCSY